MKYEKPVVYQCEDLAEGVYYGSGDAVCNSIYMLGIWQAPDYSDWAGLERGYKQQFGCKGCPAFTETGCGLSSHKPESGDASSYDADNGKRKPTWETNGYGPNDTVTDWSV